MNDVNRGSTGSDKLGVPKGHLNQVDEMKSLLYR